TGPGAGPLADGEAGERVLVTALGRGDTGRRAPGKKLRGSAPDRDGDRRGARARPVGVGLRRLGRLAGSHRRPRRRAVALHALGVRAVERQAGEELGRHAASPALVVVPAGPARSPVAWLAEPLEEGRLAPDGLEAARVADVAGQERGVDRERA